MPNRTSVFSVLLTSVVFLTTASICFSQPVITNQPAAQATAPGTTATFRVRATGTAPLAYQWQKNPGNGFADLADRTNTTLVLANVQPWDAGDYRVVITNTTGARTSAMARLYVMRPALVTTNVVLDNFDDNKPIGWNSGGGQVKLTETNQQFTVHGFWPGIRTVDLIDTVAYGYLSRASSVLNGQTLEWRVDLVGMNEHATAAVIELWAGSGAYVFFKGRDFIHVCKFSQSTGHAHLVHEMALIKNTNVVLALALTRVHPNVIITVRVLDKAKGNAVLYERSIVDTPNADRTLTPAEMNAASGMHLNTGNDVGPPFLSVSDVMLDVWQYNDGMKLAAEATFDNLERWTSLIPVTRYVDVGSANPTPPYTNWLTAATNIQDAVDAALPGDEVVVTNGTYASGGPTVGTNVLVNRVVVDKPLTLRSVNGPQFTIIQGYQVPGTTHGDGAIRCVYLTNGASLSGFTLTNGATRLWASGVGDNELSGGGVWCESTNSVVSNCVVAGNSAFGDGGGVNRGTLNNCVLSGNSAYDGGGASRSTLNNCTVTGNSASGWGGGVAADVVLNNCIVYFNESPRGANWCDDCGYAVTFETSCTTPLPTNGFGNITNAPQFVNQASGNLRLQANSPCINAGRNGYAPGPTDVDGLPRIVSGTVDIGAYEFQGPGSVISYAWLQQYGLPTDGSADAADPDVDGLNTWQEWRCLIDPTNALSVLRLLSASPAGTNVVVSWQSAAGVNYFLERSADLATSPPFILLAPNLPGQPGTTTYTDTNAAPLAPLFYRVGVGQ